MYRRYKYNQPGVEMYEVVMGGSSSQRSYISDCRPQCSVVWSANIASPLSDLESRPFWMTWYLNSSDDTNYDLVIRIGTGNVVLVNEFITWRDSQPRPINFVGVSTNGTWTFNIGELFHFHLIAYIHAKYSMTIHTFFRCILAAISFFPTKLQEQRAFQFFLQKIFQMK